MLTYRSVSRSTYHCKSSYLYKSLPRAPGSDFSSPLPATISQIRAASLLLNSLKYGQWIQQGKYPLLFLGSLLLLHSAYDVLLTESFDAPVLPPADSFSLDELSIAKRAC